VQQIGKTTYIQTKIREVQGPNREIGKGGDHHGLDWIVYRMVRRCAAWYQTWYGTVYTAGLLNGLPLPSTSVVLFTNTDVLDPHPFCKG
jgi:hypothetical protein